MGSLAFTNKEESQDSGMCNNVHSTQLSKVDGEEKCEKNAVHDAVPNE
jgi:hypothetical protein